MKLSKKYKKRIQKLSGITEFKEIEDINTRTKLKVYDFDGTLVNTPTPTDENKAIWKEKTGEDWRGGWFGNRDSLRLDVFDIPVIPSVISNFKIDRADSESLVVMLTGRIKVMGEYVKAVLDDKGLKFDDYLFNEGGPTEFSKINHMEMILKYNPSIRDVSMFDDRTPHIPIFQSWGDDMIEKGYLDKFHITHVPGFRHQ